MKGTLNLKDTGWFVLYWDRDPHYFGPQGMLKQRVKEISVHRESLSNPFLSTYWVDGREVEFEIIYESDTDGWFDGMSAKITHDDYIGEDGWDRIVRELSEQDINGVYETMKWLKENYNPPKRKE